MHTTAGAEILLDNVAAKDAPLVAQLRARRRHPGKANLSEFAGVITLGPLKADSPRSGSDQNPHGRHPTSGSSSGPQRCRRAAVDGQSSAETSGSLISPSSQRRGA
jgi:amidase